MGAGGCVSQTPIQKSTKKVTEASKTMPKNRRRSLKLGSRDLYLAKEFKKSNFFEMGPDAGPSRDVLKVVRGTPKESKNRKLYNFERIRDQRASRRHAVTVFENKNGPNMKPKGPTRC